MSNSIGINISLPGISFKSGNISREHKGKSLISFPDNFVVIDIETTGFDSHFDSIIEIAAIKVSNNIVTDSFSSLVKPYDFSELDSFITDLTGITTDMLTSAPEFHSIENDFLSFISNNILVGHNANFDINFLYDETHGKLVNDFIDTLRISRRVLTNLDHHRLSDLASYYNIQINNSHRALSDCETTLSCYNFLCSDIIQKYGSLNEFSKVCKSGLNANNIKTSNMHFDKSHPLYNKYCVFTGTLEKCVRKDAMQAVVDLGGFCQNSVTSKTNYLILGNNDYCSLIKDGKSNKQKKAEELKLKGKDIEIISENVFYDLISIDN